MNKICDTCQHFQDHDFGRGVCRRYPPGKPENGVSHWPQTKVTDSCGEWYPKAEHIESTSQAEARECREAEAEMMDRMGAGPAKAYKVESVGPVTITPPVGYELRHLRPKKRRVHLKRLRDELGLPDTCSTALMVSAAIDRIKESSKLRDCVRRLNEELLDDMLHVWVEGKSTYEVIVDEVIKRVKRHLLVQPFTQREYKAWDGLVEALGNPTDVMKQEGGLAPILEHAAKVINPAMKWFPTVEAYEKWQAEQRQTSERERAAWTALRDACGNPAMLIKPGDGLAPELEYAVSTIRSLRTSLHAALSARSEYKAEQVATAAADKAPEVFGYNLMVKLTKEQWDRLGSHGAQHGVGREEAARDIIDGFAPLSSWRRP